MNVLQINVTANSGSTGRIAEGIGRTIQRFGGESWIAYGRFANESSSHLVQIGTRFDYCEHCLESRIFDNHGLASRKATQHFIKTIDKISPDIIHLHNIHGYYINYRILFEYLRSSNIPVVWTLHDCWPFTGHCSYFTYCKCNKWEKGCFNCPQKRKYPKSLFLSSASKNYNNKLHCFSTLSKLIIVSVSHWLDNLVEQSFLGKYEHIVIHNGINTDLFSPSSQTQETRDQIGIKKNEIMLLGVADVWSERKGLQDFINLEKQLSPNHRIVLIGLSNRQIKMLPSRIIGLERTESAERLVNLYSSADLFLNLTYEDNYPTTNLEAISCGTPCLTYRTGGSPEAVNESTGFIVNPGDFQSILNAIETIEKNGKEYKKECRKYALNYFQDYKCFHSYIDLYKTLNRHKEK